MTPLFGQVTRQPVVKVGVDIRDPEVEDNLHDFLTEIATDAATALTGHVGKLVDFVMWQPMAQPNLGQADSLLKMSILQRTATRETIIQFEVLDKTSAVLLRGIDITMWDAGNFARETDSVAAVKKKIRDVLESFFTAEASSNKFRDALLEAVPVAYGIEKVGKANGSDHTYFAIGIKYDSLRPGPGLIFSVNVLVSDGTVKVPAKLFLAPSGISEGMIVATPIHQCKDHQVTVPTIKLEKSDAACDTSVYSPELPAVLNLMTKSVLKDAKVRIAHYERSKFGV
jgi:hypothetical protein